VREYEVGWGGVDVRWRKRGLAGNGSRGTGVSVSRGEIYNLDRREWMLIEWEGQGVFDIASLPKDKYNAVESLWSTRSYVNVTAWPNSGTT
jgi:hypothetical protein